jgi:hypothetical protein
MNIVPDQDLFFVFDDKVVRAMGAAFVHAHHRRRRDEGPLLQRMSPEMAQAV